MLFFSTGWSSQAQEGKWIVAKTTNPAPNYSGCGMAAVNGKLYLIGNGGEGMAATVFNNGIYMAGGSDGLLSGNNMNSKLPAFNPNNKPPQQRPEENRPVDLEIFEK